MEHLIVSLKDLTAEVDKLQQCAARAMRQAQLQAEREPRISKEKLCTALCLDKVGTWDYALPQDWLNQAADTGVQHGISYDEIVSNLIWMYDDKAKIFGRPFGITPRGVVIVELITD